jgi:hydrogenase maturation protease
VNRRDPPSILILACGNTLRGDDGVAWRIASLLEEGQQCDGIDITCTQQLLPEHAELVSAADQVVFLDCSALTPAGTVTSTPIEPAERLPSLFTHNLDPAALLRLALDLYGRSPSSAMLITIGGQSFDLNEALSGPVAAAIPLALDAIRLTVIAS